MGVLDEAIKEHLELKRKQGAAEDELQRQEEEALGPPRRDVAQQHGEEADSAVAVQETDLFDGEDGPPAKPSDEVAPPPEPLAGEPAPVAGQPPPLEEPPVGPALEPTPIH